LAHATLKTIRLPTLRSKNVEIAETAERLLAM